MTVALPRMESIWHVMTRRIRAGGTIFGDRVKLVLRQGDMAHWSKLGLPYLLVVPVQTRQPHNLEIDVMSFVCSRLVTLVAQFDANGSEAEYGAANDVELAERQLIFLLANWTPPSGSSPISFFRPTLFSGSRFQDSREPNVKVHYYFSLEEQYILEQELEIDEDDLMTLDTIKVSMSAAPCLPCEPELPAGPKICVEERACKQVDPCAEPECPSILEGKGE